MLNICICDDEDKILCRMVKLIKEMAEKNSLSLNIYTYHTGEELLFDVINSDKIIDVFFMDVLMPGISGIETANTLRDKINDVPIVFLTSSKDHVFEALDVMPLHYLLKQDVTTEKIEKVLLKAVGNAELKRKQVFVYKTGKILGNVLFKEILYFEVKNRIIDIHLKNDKVISFYSNMAEVEGQVDDSWFVRSHRSFMVNLENVDYLDGKNLVFTNKETVPVGQKYMKTVKEKYKSFLLCGLEEI